MMEKSYHQFMRKILQITGKESIDFNIDEVSSCIFVFRQS